MINMTGKVLGILLAVLATVISVPSAALLTMFAAEALKGGPDAGIFTILAVSMAALDITVFVLMYWANRRYDEAEGYRNDQDRIGRWVRYLLFGNLVTVFLMMMIEVSISHPEWTERAPWLLTALILPVSGLTGKSISAPLCPRIPQKLFSTYFIPRSSGWKNTFKGNVLRNRHRSE